MAVGLPHHVPVQSPLRGPQTAPLLRGEVHGHVCELQRPRLPSPSPARSGLSWSPCGERSRRRRHWTREAGATAVPVPARTLADPGVWEPPLDRGRGCLGGIRRESESVASGANGTPLAVIQETPARTWGKGTGRCLRGKWRRCDCTAGAWNAGGFQRSILLTGAPCRLPTRFALKCDGSALGLHALPPTPCAHWPVAEARPL